MGATFSFVKVVWLLSIVAASGRGPATPPSAAPDPPESQEYRALLGEALSEYDAGRYGEARALFRRAHEISPNARTLRGIGMASFELNEYAETVRSLEASLIDKRRPLTSAQRKQVQDLLGRARVFVGRFRPRLSPQGAALSVDGLPAVLDGDGNLLLSLGQHFMTAEAPGMATENREVSVAGGESVDLIFALGPVDASGAARSQRLAGDGSLGLPNAEKPGDGSRSSGAGKWLAGAVLFAGGAVAGFYWWRFQNDQTTSCDGAIAHDVPCRNRDTLLLRERLALGVTIAGAAGALALGTVSIVKARNGKQNGKETAKPGSSTAFMCGPGSGGVSCVLRLSF